MRDWIAALAKRTAADDPVVLVTVVAAKGSIPRRPGARMLVTRDGIEGTIGGGHLEYEAIDIARGLFAGDGSRALRRFPLGASLGQCCGGLAEVLFEPLRGSIEWCEMIAELRDNGVSCALLEPTSGNENVARLTVTEESTFGTLGDEHIDREAIRVARAALTDSPEPRLVTVGGDVRIQCFLDVVHPPDFRIVLFGAGHVGRAVVDVLARIRCGITWVETRDAQFPAAVPDNVRCVSTDAAEAEVDAAPAGTYFLVMTHSHAQDEALTERILMRDDFAYFGLIGSNAKRRQFERRLEARGMTRPRFSAMTCPIGIAGISGKEPEVIAIAVAAELLQVRSRMALARDAHDAHRA